MTRILVFLVSLFLVSSTIYSQDNDSVTINFYNKLFENYAQESVLNYNYDVKQYDTSRKILIKQISGKVSQSKNRYIYEIDNVISIMQDSIYLNIFKDKKQIYVHILDSIQINQVQGFSPTNMVAILKKNNIKISLKPCDYKELECYNMIYGKLDKDLYEIRLDKKTGLIKELFIDYYGANDKQTIESYFMEISYDNYKRTKLKKFSPMEEYIKIKEKGEIELVDNKKDFELIKF
jgi:hypothetical protein